ncbi:hypothetical protein ACOMHN_020326 [Nucella lapillus]
MGTELVMEEQETWFSSNPAMSPRYENLRDAPSPRQFDFADLPVLSREEEEEEAAERHAFQPVEPAVYNNKGSEDEQVDKQVDT